MARPAGSGLNTGEAGRMAVNAEIRARRKIIAYANDFRVMMIIAIAALTGYFSCCGVRRGGHLGTTIKGDGGRGVAVTAGWSLRCSSVRRHRP